MRLAIAIGCSNRQGANPRVIYCGNDVHAAKQAMADDTESPIHYLVARPPVVVKQNLRFAAAPAEAAPEPPPAPVAEAAAPAEPEAEAPEAPAEDSGEQPLLGKKRKAS